MSRVSGLRRAVFSLGFTLMLVASCADVGNRAPGAISSGGNPGDPPPPVVLTSSCVDLDHDGFGTGCVPGPDCDDQDPLVTDQCRACLRPATGCACDPDETPVPCNLATDTTEVSPEGVCHLGQRVCRSGSWSQCEALSDAPGARVIGAVSPCYGQCDPTCQHFVDCITPTDSLPGSTFVSVSTLPQAVFCPSSTPAGGVQPLCENRPGGPYARSTSTLTWIDACAAAGSQTVLAGADEGNATVAIPFSFSYWGVPYRTVNINPNGVAQFSLSASQWVNTTLPAPSAPNAVLAFWDDLLMRTGVCVATVGTAPSRRVVIEWADAAFYPVADAATHLTFEIVLSEATQAVDVLYNTMQGNGDLPTGSSATIGVQEGGGTRFDLVGYNTPNVVTSGAAFRWSPTSNDQFCEAGTYRRSFEASCPAGAVPTIPTWGLLNYSSYVPGGASIRMEVRAADTAADLATATAIRLPDAPRATTTAPSTSGYELGDILTAASPHLGHARFVELTAYFDPGPDANLAPALGSMELQFRCRPVESPYRCQAGSSCLTSGVCRRGVISCSHPLTPVCVDAGPLPVGTTCAPRSVCNSVGNCVPCNEGATCSTGNVCEFGRISCATGAPVCTRVSYLPSGAVCGLGTGAYTRDTSSLGWIDACSVPGATRYLTATADGAATVTLPFPFALYGTTYTQVGFSTNGLLGFPTAPTTWTNTALPSAGIGDAIMAYWDDLQTRPEGVCVAVLGRAPGRIFVVEWANTDLQDRGSSGDLGASLNFEAVLEESTQAVNVLFGDMVGDARASGSSATVGIQRADGTRYDQFAFNTAGAVRANSSVRWSPPVSSTCNGTGTCTACTTSETCDGRDNNCNALIDEGIPDISCGVGACRRTVPGCVRGAVQTCTPGTPSAEICNGLDDNCNGSVDEMCMGTITCPGDTSMWAGDTQSFTVATMGVLSSFNWSIVSAPSGGATTARFAPTPATSTTESFNPIIVGVYRIQVSGIDGLGQMRSCAFNVTANSRGLRVELSWNGTGDVDVHLHNNVSGAWFSTPNDCHYANMNPTWGASQDVDNVTANGPENIRVNTPTVGTTYTVGVHNYARGAGRTATVKIYCGPTAGTTPSVIFASLPLAGTSSGNCTGNTFWKVANVVIAADGSCTITPLNVYTTSNSACSSR
ncbi:MAG: MopE-related protein [Polyangiales bacterium]